MQKKLTLKNSLEHMDILLLLIIFAAIVSQYFIGPARFITIVLRSTVIAGMMFYAGYISSTQDSCQFVLLKKAGFYACLFFITGIIYQIPEGFTIPKCISNMATFRSIPRYSDLFFTITMLFFACAVLHNYISRLSQHLFALCILSILLLGLVYFPKDIIGYPVLGAFIGCDSYRCIALLPYFSYFAAGILAASKDLLNRKILLPVTLLVTVVSLLLRNSIFKPLTQVCAVAFPVLFIAVFIMHSQIYAFLLSNMESIRNRTISIFRKAKTSFETGGTRNLFLYFSVYTLLFLLITNFVFSVFYANGSSFVSIKDAIAQYVPCAHYFINHIQHWFSELLSGNINLSTFDFSIGMGRSVSHSFEPLYWLYSFFNADNVEYAYAFVIIVRMFFTGLSVSAMFLYLKRNYYEMLFGSIIYTFCGYALYQCTRNGQFLVPMILLPLSVIAIEEIIRNKRWYICTIVITLTLLSTYYYLYVNTLVIGIYYVIRFLLEKNPSIRNWKYFFRRSFTLAGSYILGVCMGSIALFPALSSYLGSSRSGDSVLPTSSLLFYSKSWLVKCYMSLIALPNSIGYALKFGFVPLVYITIIILFIRKENKLLKTLFITTSAFCIFPVFAYILSVFNTVTHRWSYAFALVVTAITVYTLPTLRTLSKRELKITFIALMPYGLILLLDSEFRTASMLSAFAILLANYTVILLMNENFAVIRKRTAQTGLLLLSVFSIWLNAYYQYTEGYETTEDWYVPSGETMNTLKSTPLCALTDMNDDSFYRVSTSDISYKTLNSSLVMGYRGISDFSSVMIGSISDYNSIMGNSEHNLVHLDGFDNRTAMNALASVKYHSLKENEKGVIPYGYTFTEQKEIDNNTYNIFKNEYALPLGYTYSNIITEEELENYTSLEKQQVLLQAACVDSFESSTSTEHIVTDIIPLEITDIKTDGVIISEDSISITKPDASVTFTFNGIENAETYIEFKGSYIASTGSSETSTTVNIYNDNFSRYYKLYPDDNTYNTNQDTYLYNAGYHQDALNSFTVRFTSPQNLTPENPDIISVNSFRICAQPMDNYTTYINNLNENPLENVSISSNKITGNIRVSKDKFLVLSIPYQNGWTAYVDGKETEIQKANIMYMGFFLTEGEHSITLTYERPGMRLAFIVTLIGLFTFITALIIRRYRIKIVKNKTN